MKTTAIIPTMRSLTNGRAEWDVLRSAFETLNSFESTLFSDPFFNDFFALNTSRATKFPKVDVWETTTGYEVEANVAGLSKDEIGVEINDTYITLKGEKKDSKKQENGKYLVSELSYKKFHRQIPLPEAINQEGVEAKYDNGILRVTLPKQVLEVKPVGKKIEIK